MSRLLAIVAGPLVGLVLCVRLQLEILQRWPGGGWPALAAGWASAGLLLALIAGTVLGLRAPRRWLGVLVGGPLTALALGGLSTLPLPSSHFSSPSLHDEWSRLHPALRSCLWIVRLGDDELVITDLSRVPADYAAMGLPTPSSSAHFPAATDGYARAVDVRLCDAGPWQRWVRSGLFLALGLRAEAHAGTADHLHVSLPSSPPPGPAPELAAAPPDPAPGDRR